MQGQEGETHAPAGGGDTKDEFDYLHLSGVSEPSDEEGLRIQLGKA